MENQYKKMTIGDIAEQLGVSKTTVSRAISGKGRIGAETRDKILEYIKEHNYRPNVIAKGLAKSRTYNIGLTLGDYDLMDLPFFQKCMIGVSEMATSMDYDVIISTVSAGDISQLERMVTNHKVDGVILTRTLLQDPPAEFLKSRQIPFVVIGTTLDKSIIQIDNDHRSACKELTSILLMKGLKKIALIGGSRSYVVTEKRLKGFMDAYEEMGMKADNDLIYLDAESNFMINNNVEELIRKKADCILCMDDNICTFVLNKLKKEKIKVPNDILVASFYNSSLLENNDPSITSLQFNVKELGNVSCKILLDHIKGKSVPNRTLLGYEVSMKESTQLR